MAILATRPNFAIAFTNSIRELAENIRFKPLPGCILFIFGARDLRLNSQPPSASGPKIAAAIKIENNGINDSKAVTVVLPK